MPPPAALRGAARGGAAARLYAGTHRRTSDVLATAEAFLYFLDPPPDEPGLETTPDPDEPAADLTTLVAVARERAVVAARQRDERVEQINELRVSVASEYALRRQAEDELGEQRVETERFKRLLGAAEAVAEHLRQLAGGAAPQPRARGRRTGGDPNDDASTGFPECRECGARPGQAHDPSCSGAGVAAT